MDFKKKLTLALMALSVSGVAAAGTYMPPACTSHAVTIPCENSGWDIGFEAFFVEASSDYQVFAGDNLANLTTNGTVLGAYKVDPSYEFGFELEGSFHFGTGNDITVAWERADNDESTSVTNTAGLDILLVGDSITLAGPVTLTTTNVIGNVTSTVDYDFNAVNAEFGQHIDVGDDVDMRVHMGLQYASIDYTKTVAWADPLVAGNVNTVNSESDFDGFGVRVGSDFAYHIGDGFSVLARVSASLLVGDIDTTAAYNTVNSAGTTLATGGALNCEDSVVVPAGMTKIGARYAADVFDGNFSVEGGWRMEGYYHAMRFAQGGGLSESFTFHGPYIALKYVG